MANGILDGYEFPHDVAAPFGIDYGTGLRVDVRTDTFNQHGVISGATGAGKSRDIQLLIEWLSERGVSCLLSDGKGDMSGLAKAGELDEKAQRRADRLGQDWWEETFLPVEFLALGGHGIGVPLNFTIGSFGYESIGKLAKLSEPQMRHFKTAWRAINNDSSRPTESIEDLCALVRGFKDDPDSSIGDAMANRIIDNLENFEYDNPGLFGGPDFDIMDLIRVDDEGYGQVSIIDSTELQDNPAIVTTSILWVLDKLLKTLPEVGNKEMKMVIFIDEAHTLFEGDTPRAFVDKFRMTIKKLRSKGVGIFLCTQNLADIPDDILSQCALRIQHVIRVNTAKQRTLAKRTAETFPDNGDYNVLKELTAMPTGRALVTILDEDGFMTPPACVDVFCPRTSLDPMTRDEIAEVVEKSELTRKYRRLAFEREERERNARRAPLPFLPGRSAPSDDADLFAALRGSVSRPERHPSADSITDALGMDDDDIEAAEEYMNEQSGKANENIWG